MKQRKDGRFVKVIIHPVTGKRISIYGKTEKEVMRKLLLWQKDAEQGRMFTTVAAEYWQRHEPELSEQSKRTYRQAVDRSVEFFGTKRFKEIQPRDISRFFDNLAGQGYSARTVSNQRMVLNQICKYACIQGDATANPVQWVTVPKGLPKQRRTSATTADEEAVLRNPHVWIAPYIAIMTGMRRGEILALQWKDIDFNAGTITVSKSIAFKGNTPFIKEPKTRAGVRTVPMLTPLRAELLKRRKAPERFIVSRTGKEPLTNIEFTRAYARYQKRVGISATMHQLRHSFATIAFESGVPAKTVQELLGHSQLSTTMDIYTDVRSKSLDDAVEKLEKSLLLD